LNLTPRQRRVWWAWQAIGFGGMAAIGGLLLLSVRRGIDPKTWAPFAFGAVAIGFGSMLATFPAEFEGIFRQRLGAYGYAGGLPLRGVGVCFILVGGSMVLQALLA
jgi:hypothetical protein